MKKTLVQRLFSTAPVLILLTLSLAVAISCVIILTNLNRGFDFGDEAWAYSLISNDADLVGEAWGFQHLLHPLFNSVGNQVLAFRAIRLGLYVFGAFVSASTVITLIRLRGISLFGLRKATVFLASGVGASLAWAYPPKYLSYNELASTLLILLLNCWVQLLSISNQKQNYKFALRVRFYFAIIGLGIFIPLLIVSRLPSGLLGLTVSCLVYFSLDKAAKVRIAPILALTIALSTFILLRVLGFPLEFYFSQWWIELTSKGQSDAGHPISYLISTYGHSLLSAIVATVPIIVAGLALFMRRSAEKGPAANSWVFVSLATTIVLLNLSVNPQNHMDTWMNIGTLIAVCVLLILYLEIDLFLGSSSTRPQNSKFRFLSTSIVISVPLCASIGTNNALLGQFMFTAAPVFALLVGLLWTRLVGPHSLPTAAAFSLIVMSISIWSISAVWADQALHPYGTLPASQQVFETKAEILRGLHVDSATRAEVDGLSRLAEVHDVNSSSLVISLESPGAHLFFGNSKAIGPWINSVSPASIEGIGVACLERPKSHVYVISRNSSPSQDVLVGLVNKRLGECSLQFPKNFTQIATIRGDSGSLLSIWRSQLK